MSIDAQAALASANSALQTVAQAFAEKDAALNALSLQADSLSAANVALQAQLDTANAAIVDLKAKLDALQPKPPAPKTVFDYGAKGDGVTDDTVAIQKAIDAGDGRVPGKTPVGQAARFLINSLRVPSGTSFYGLLVATGQRLVCDPEAVFVVKANSAPRNMCIRLDGGYMEGGQVLGDRVLHTYSGTSTHEWGYGVQLRGDNPQAIGVKVSQCTGDGFGVSGNKPVMRDCVSTGNRRQGLSVFTSTGFRAYNCQFNDTKGTAPQAGVDFEPDAGGSVTDAVMENCTAKNNGTAGFMGWVRSEVVGNIEVTLKNCDTEGNSNGVQSKGLNGKVILRVEGGNHVNRSSGLRAEDGSVVTLVGPTYSFAGKTPSYAQQYAIQVLGTAQVTRTGVIYK